MIDGEFGTFANHCFIHGYHVDLIHHGVSEGVGLRFVKFEFLQSNIHAFIDNLGTDHGASGDELSSHRFLVRILSDRVEDNVGIKK